jgi:peptide/nickel transport system substrate-binding protein
VKKRITAACALLMAVALTATACGGSESPAEKTSRIVVGGYDYTTLYPGGDSFIARSSAVSQDIYGTLFDEPAEDGGDFVPDLATGYSYSADYKTLTVDLREGVKFQDGTPFDAEAVAFNFEEYQKAGVNTQYYKALDSVETPTRLQVVAHFSAPVPALVSQLAYTSAGLIGSPTAIKSMGAEKFGVNPVGAGPFQVVSHNPGQELVVKKNETYYDAANVKLDQIRYIHTSSDAQVALEHVSSGSIDAVALSAPNTAPTVFKQAQGNDRLKVTSGDNNLYAFVAMNTFKPPFDKPEARQAIAYCTDRESIAQNVQGGVVTPGYLLAGTDSLYYPEGGADAAKASYPYPFDPAKGKAIVQQLGGLSFKFTNIGGQYMVISNALAQQWKECGIEASVEAILGPALTKDFSTGDFQASYVNTGGINDPNLSTSFLSPNTPQGKYNFAGNYPEIVKLVSDAASTADRDVLATTWRKIWSDINKAAVNIPIITGGPNLIANKCLEGFALNASSPTFKHARLTC